MMGANNGAKGVYIDSVRDMVNWLRWTKVLEEMIQKLPAASTSASATMGTSTSTSSLIGTSSKKHWSKEENMAMEQLYWQVWEAMPSEAEIRKKLAQHPLEVAALSGHMSKQICENIKVYTRIFKNRK